MASSVTVRSALPGDGDLIVAFNRAMALETEGLTLDAAASDAGVRRAFEEPGRCAYYVAEIDGAVVGQTMVTTEWSDWRNGYFWWIQSVYVACANRRQGVFRALHDHIRSLARSRDDVCGLRLYVFKGNTRALQTYDQLGMLTTDYLLCEEVW